MKNYEHLAELLREYAPLQSNIDYEGIKYDVTLDKDDDGTCYGIIVSPRLGKKDNCFASGKVFNVNAFVKFAEYHELDVTTTITPNGGAGLWLD